jgi:hypothetical protein
MESNRFWESIKFFKYTEFSAPEDSESGLLMNHYLIMTLDELAQITGHEVIIHPNGGFSFKGHSDGSFHYHGMAADFHFGWSRSIGALRPDKERNTGPWKLSVREQAKIILGMGKFGGVGVYPEWKPVPGFHVDVRPGFQIWKKVGADYVYFF